VGYYNKIIGGIIFIVLGIFITGISDYNYAKLQTVLKQCQSIEGFGEFLSPAECNNVSTIFSTSMVGSLIGIIVIIIGLILLIVGIVKRKKSKVISRSRNQIPSEEIIEEQSKEQEIESNTFNENKIDDSIPTDEKMPQKYYEYENEKIYCRYCGKIRPIKTEYCSLCGRSSISKSENMKKCIGCNSLVSEDSGFCSNCGKEF
jgi:RNA polymerase subunit RPABC4/transcription elongation factor Spt4